MIKVDKSKFGKYNSSLIENPLSLDDSSRMEIG